MPKWMNKCARCGELVGGEHVLLIGADGQVMTMYHIPCFLAANLEPGQLSDQVSATWGGKRGRAVTTTEYDKSKRAILAINAAFEEDDGIS